MKFWSWVFLALLIAVYACGGQSYQLTQQPELPGWTKVGDAVSFLSFTAPDGTSVACVWASDDVSCWERER